MADGTALADVIPLFPSRPRSCFICTHGSPADGDTYCQVFQERVADEATAASDCPAYDDDPRKT